MLPHRFHNPRRKSRLKQFFLAVESILFLAVISLQFGLGERFCYRGVVCRSATKIYDKAAFVFQNGPWKRAGGTVL